MKMKHCRPRCEAITKKGERCQMVAAKYKGRLCRYHDPELSSATHERNRIATRSYWERWRAAKGVVSTEA